MKETRSSHIVHVFALMHAAIVLLCHLFSVRDELVLTVTTVLLIVILCMRRRQSTGVMAVCIIAGNILGFVIGIYGARVLDWVIAGPTMRHAVMSFVTTEILGFGMLLAFRLFGRRARQSGQEVPYWRPNMWQIIFVIAIFMALRIVISRIFTGYFTEDSIWYSFRMVLTNSPALLTIICFNILYLRFTHHSTLLARPVGYVMGLALDSLAIAVAAALIVGYRLPFGTDTPFEGAGPVQLSAVSFLCSLASFVVIFLVDYAFQTRARLDRERDRSQMAQFRYDRLKLQISPHFLFNSLNILDYLVQEHQTDRASAFIRRLADTYRYTLKNESEPMVPLGEEIAFARKYVELLKERFTDGFETCFDIAEGDMSRRVVPCCLQLLIENATKHNIVSPEQPLRVRISSDGESISVANNLQPRITTTPSIGIGLETIRRQYLTLSGKEIEISQTRDEYRVTVPLL